ncbi:DNA circularization protein [Aliamphritea ceti]|uniref:DNA circularization protein n=1 Tax=Aliamphritea ceti TaxID=1524258 RepID=UPI0021C4A7E3|nr:DNA circularization N-terminal domain-containing protein [Aliamphritea ceti]
MSKWLKTLHAPSFRGIPFSVIEDPEAEIGRRMANHEYAGRDEPYSEDTGRKQKVYKLTFAVYGDDFIKKAHALIDAIDTAGPGLLVHPHHGELQVTAEGRVSYQGRQATFQATFYEAGHNNQPGQTADTAQLITDKSLAAEVAAIKSFETAYDVTGPSFVADQAVADVTESLQSVVAAGQNINTSIAAVINKPGELANQILSSVRSVSSLNKSIANTFQGFKSLSEANASSSDTSVSSTPMQQKMSNNKAATQLLVKQLAATQLAKSVPNMNFQHQAEAEQIGLDAADLIEQASWESDDQAFIALTDLRIAVQQDVQEKTPSLAVLEAVNLPQTMPALVAAYRYTGNASNEAQIINRNNITHPGFVSGRVEVLNV